MRSDLSEKDNSKNKKDNKNKTKNLMDKNNKKSDSWLPNNF